MSKVWPPFTPLAWSDERLTVVSAQGNKLTLADGRVILDGISSWWTNLHGHGHPKLVEAVSNQAATLDHVIFAGFTHQPAEELAEKLLSVAPTSIDRIFYSDNGSTAIEVALKLAVQYWEIQGQKRNKIIAFEGAYHGDTFGAMSAGARGLFTGPFESLLFEVERFEYPETWPGDEWIDTKEAEIFESLNTFLEKNHSQTAAAIIEPLIQGAGGMRFCRPEFVKALEQICRKWDVLLILDEVMTGFGRTGAFFATEICNVEPDFMALSKGISGGLMPLGATLISSRVSQAFNSDSFSKTFFHGHSYAGNPIACAAGSASFDLLMNAFPDINRISESHQNIVQKWTQLFPNSHARSSGTVLAVEFDGTSNDYKKPVSKVLRELFLKDGILLRPLGNTIYVLPPYCTTNEELEFIYSSVEEKFGLKE